MDRFRTPPRPCLSVANCCELYNIIIVYNNVFRNPCQEQMFRSEQLFYGTFLRRKQLSGGRLFPAPRRRVVRGSGRARRHKTKARLRENILLQVKEITCKGELILLQFCRKEEFHQKITLSRTRDRRSFSCPSPSPVPPLPARNTQSHHQVNKPYKRGSRWKKIHVSVRSGGATG